MRYLTLLTTLITINLTIRAQSHIAPYELTPDYMQQVFSDIIRTECNTINFGDANGRYIGHTYNNSFFGWGSYTTSNGNQWVGQWNRGKCIFGILIKDTEGRVGSDSHHVKYDLNKGTVIHIIKDNETFSFAPTEAAAYPYRFVRLHYANGDYYIGETKNGQRHGQGIYYWANGEYWYGTFSEGYRQGYGALFKADGSIEYGLWLGEDKQQQ